MGKLQTTQSGFTALEVIIIVLVIGVIGFSGLFLLNAKKHANKSAAGSNATTTTKSTSKPPDTTPAPVFGKLDADWIEYKNDANGLRFGYPREFGVLSGTPLTTSDYENDAQNIQGRVTISMSAKESFSISARKYGATITPSSDGKTWIVSAENPAAVDGYKVGDTYKTKNIIVNGGMVIDLTSFDEGCTMPQYLATLKDSYAVISIPELCPVNSTPISSTNNDAYNKLTANFIASITLY